MKVGVSLQEFIASDLDANEWKSYAGRLRRAGVAELNLSALIPGGVMFESATVEAAQSRGVVAIYAKARRYTAEARIDWNDPRPCRAAIDELATTCQGFDQLTRFTLAASDMAIVAAAAHALVDAHENDGPARLYDRVIETGMVVTYARPFLESNEAGIPRRWWPKGDDKALHVELCELRHEYHAHAAHTARRRLENLADVTERPRFVESWERLSSERLRAIADLADRLAATLRAEAEKTDRDLFAAPESE